MNQYPARILDVASYLPEKILGNTELSAVFPDWSPEKIYEKTGIENCDIYQFKTFDEFGEENNLFRMLAVSYIGILKSDSKIIKENKNTKDAAWFKIDCVPNLAFKHNEIMSEALEKLKSLIILLLSLINP